MNVWTVGIIERKNTDCLLPFPVDHRDETTLSVIIQEHVSRYLQAMKDNYLHRWLARMDTRIWMTWDLDIFLSFIETHFFGNIRMLKKNVQVHMNQTELVVTTFAATSTPFSSIYWIHITPWMGHWGCRIDLPLFPYWYSGVHKDPLANTSVGRLGWETVKVVLKHPRNLILTMLTQHDTRSAVTKNRVWQCRFGCKRKCHIRHNRTKCSNTIF